MKLRSVLAWETVSPLAGTRRISPAEKIRIGGRIKMLLKTMLISAIVILII
jgi:hypothetical protein